MTQAKLKFYDFQPSGHDFKGDVLAGLQKTPHYIEPKYFYDQRGSQLFEAITETQEYYPTRTEIDILRSNADEIARQIGAGTLLVEPGSGSCSKVKILLEGLKPCAYVPMDISKQHLWAASKQVAVEFPWLEIHAACADFTQNIQLPSGAPSGKKVAFFPGSSIGNYDPEDAIQFLTMIAEMVGEGGNLLIGVDLKKNKTILEKAYNDASGQTAAFNLNLLRRINRELAGNFNLIGWKHKAFYNEDLGRIEMHLISAVEQWVHIGAKRFLFQKDETIHTENSYKYTIDEFVRLAQETGFALQKVWTDVKELFSVQLYSR